MFFPFSEETFERLITLRNDPEAFEAERKRLIDEHISSNPADADHLRWIQKQIDLERNPKTDPIVAIERFRVLMQNTLARVGDLHNIVRKARTSTDANVIPISVRRKNKS